MKTKTLLLSVVSLLALVLAAPAQAKSKKMESPSPTATASPEASSEMKKPRVLPYHGKVVSVDASAKSFVVGKRTFMITSETKIMKDGADAAMSDLTAGVMVGGGYWKKDDGSLEAKSVKIKTMSATSDEEKKTEIKK